MSNPSVTGVIHVIEETKTFGQKGFRKRLVVLEQDNGRFTNYLPMEFIQDGCDTVDELKIGQKVEMTYRLSGRKWQRDPQSEVKYFLSAEAMSFKVLEEGATPQAQQGPDDWAASADADEEVPF